MFDIRDFIDDVARSVAFLSRIHMPQRHFVNFDGRLSRAVRAFPIAGLLIVLPAAAIVSIFTAINASPLFTAFVAVAIQALITGALHEDGLSDTADGLGGGKTKESALLIMKDSRIGSYGAVALILSFGLRVSALAAVLPLLTPSGAGLLVLATAALSRTAMVWHWSRLPPARRDGVAASAGEPDASAVTVALVIGVVSAALLLFLSGASLLSAVLAIAAFAATVPAFSEIVDGKIGGHTGDTIGATQQLTEIAVLAALALTI
ncbi:MULTISPECIES: adenosylcobinamide-GDP ribazoletransferase [unclassified Rhizobium]|uniref:adenosylcobinamide-GDP ribazoletransferase n=1 Tax=unclassified Rhizobium TaxID=2613769 RepID=UPI0007149968|nr:MULTISPECIES: adenosylcobinamide-GDP ribazoletransferase [unclassified Rhizobium]KQS98099.1 cobalamin synthase [Rhizobium sp. Leaf386]KQT00361.1 cobalamin synthase [Rhizobium sp. Leaf391]KQT97364.1 cobalamin synthase [Rhizobium sp. Leaf453]